LREDRPYGFWVSVSDPAYFLGIEGARYSIASGGRIREVARIVDAAGPRLHLCKHGRNLFYEVTFDEAELILRDPETGETLRFRRLAERPKELVLEPIHFPRPNPIPESRMLAIQGELWRRLAVDQEVLRLPPGKRKEDLPPWLASAPEPPRELSLDHLRRFDVQADNTAYLRTLISEVGWIDVARFGYPASNAAFLLVQHSRDLPLMMAALESIRRDLDAGHPVAEAYALLYDRVHLMLGEKQFYGSQMDYDESGYPIVYPLEAPETVEARRSELGMIPLARYVKVFGADELQISQACAGPAAPRK
jgi:hypothetical protein